MAKLYPPRIPSTIPAFELKTGTEISNTTISVPFFLNRLTGQDEVKYFTIKLKSGQTSEVIFSITISAKIDYFKNGVVEFNIGEDYVNKLNKGEFYKIQLANHSDYEDKNLYFSDVAIVKATGSIDAKIEGITQASDDEENKTFFDRYNFIGADLTATYSNTDITEKLYSSHFVLYDENGFVKEDSGELLHNNGKNGTTSTGADGALYWSTKQSYTFKTEFNLNAFYKVEWIYTTVNGLTKSTGKYAVVRRAIGLDLNTKLEAKLDFENGFVDLSLVEEELGSDKLNKNQTVTGKFIVSRHSSKNPGVWEELFRFDLQNELPERHLWKDTTVEQGITYTYGIQQINNYNIITERATTKPVYVDFEFMFLSDKNRQLKIAFNPKVSSFKPVILETKTDTIGGKYPHVFRNGQVYYHEIPLSGLISFHLDDSNLFTSENELEEILMNEEKPTDQVSIVIAKERLFKREVLKWLTNGQPKILRTPTEGNFIVRLLNVSMSPEDKLGRMIHNFTATAYEIADYNFKELTNLDLKQDEDEDIDRSMYYTARYLNTFGADGEILNVYSVSIEDVLPGYIFYVMKNNNDIDYSIVVGTSGTYEVKLDTPTKFKFPEAKHGIITYTYKDNSKSTFDKVKRLFVEFCTTILQNIDEIIGGNLLSEERIKVSDVNDKEQGRWEIPYFYRIYIQKKLESETQVFEKTEIILPSGTSIELLPYEFAILHDDRSQDEMTNLQVFSIQANDDYLIEKISNIKAIYSGSGLVVDAIYEKISIIMEADN